MAAMINQPIVDPIVEPPQTENPIDGVSRGTGESSLASCDALLICLSNRRFVIAWDDRPRDLWPINGGWEKLPKLKPGDEVIYKGDRVVVRAIDIYR